MASAEAAPVSPDEALTAFSPTLGRSGVALAVSGGADSLSLLHLWADARALAPNLPPAVVLTVDHGLRAEAAAEAAFVARVAAERGLAHRTLTWIGAKPAANLQAEARAARRRLLVEAVADLGFDTLLLAHHADDQAETFLSRLARGSGVLGLAAMAPARFDGAVSVLRPFLGWPKARLVASLTARGATWIEDPSNRDLRFERARWRAAMPMLADLGLDRDRLVATAAAMARAAAALEREVDALLARAFVHPAGFLRVSVEDYTAAAEEIRLRAVARTIADLGGEAYGPRLAGLEAIDADLTVAGATPVVRTLGGVRIERRRGWIWFAPEAGRTAARRLAPGGRLIFPLGAPGRRHGTSGGRHADGGGFRIERRDRGFAAAWLGRAFFVCADGVLAPLEGEREALNAAFESGGAEMVRSLRWMQPAEAGRCWFIGKGWSLSYDEVG